jgi:ribonuclease BN (tRNA processing enzyme)
MGKTASPPLELTFLGSGNAFAGDRYWSSFILNRRYLFDAPPTTLPHLTRLLIPTLDIAAVFITHFHADHFFGLPFLFLDYEYVSKRRENLVIVGPHGVQKVIEELTELGFSGLTPNENSYRRVYLEVAPGEEQVAADLPFRAIAVEQSSETDCLGYKVNVGGRALSYTGDTMMCDGVRELARGADALIIECSCWDDPCDHHMSLPDIQRLRKDTPPETTFVLTHLEVGRPPIDIPGVLVADDFATFRL